MDSLKKTEIKNLLYIGLYPATMRQTPVGGGHKNLADFLKKDKLRIQAEADKLKNQRLQQEIEKREHESRIQEAIEAEKQSWKTFYDGNGYCMRMHFTWNFGNKFFLSPVDDEEDSNYQYNYVWSDPDYGGDDTIKPYYGTAKEFFSPNWGRYKGQHTVRSYCGNARFVSQ